MQVSTRVEAAVSAATTERPGSGWFPKAVGELEEVAPQVVADPLRAERKRGHVVASQPAISAACPWP